MKEIRVFSTTQRFVHWLHVVAFLVLMTTGALLYVPAFRGFIEGDGGYLSRLLHRGGAVTFMLLPLLYVAFDPRGMLDSLQRIFRWGKDDLGWLKAAPRYYFFGDDRNMPPQDKFNTGQKLFYDVVVLGMVGFIATGLIMWFGKGSVSPTVFLLSVLVHDLCTIAYGAFFLVHLLLTLAHPLMKGSIDGMLFGWLPEDYLKHHHARYYEELSARKRLVQQRQAAPRPQAGPSLEQA